MEFATKTKPILLAVAMIFLLLFLHYLKITRPIENAVVYAVKPVLLVMNSGSKWIRANYLEYKAKDELLKENNDLNKQVAQLLLEKAQCGLEKEENEFLREQAKFFRTHKYDYQIAQVIGAGADPSQNSVIIDKGARQGIENNQPVIVENGILVGKISKAGDYSSIVLFLNDDLSKIAVSILNENRTIGVVEGEYGLGMRMKLISKEEAVKEGDIIITSGLETGVPRGLLVGAVKSVKNEPEELFLEAAVEPPLDFSKISLVSVLKTKTHGVDY